MDPDTVELDLGMRGLAVVALRGECDLNTRAALAAALARACACEAVLVDLCDCSFIDSTVIGAIVVTSQSLRAAGGRLELVIPPHQDAVRRIAQIAGLPHILVIHETRSAGIASIQSEE